MSTHAPDDATETIGRPVATALPCPDWCTLPPGHPFETTDPDANPLRLVGAPDDGTPAARLFRVHRRQYGENATHVAVESYERCTSGGPANASCSRCGMPTTALVHHATANGHAYTTGLSDLNTDPEATVVRLQLPEAHGYLTPNGARRLAAQLLAAADQAEHTQAQAMGRDQ